MVTAGSAVDPPAFTRFYRQRHKKDSGGNQGARRTTFQMALNPSKEDGQRSHGGGDRNKSFTAMR